jgi:rhodanese-related sulfurtransferase
LIAILVIGFYFLSFKAQDNNQNEVSTMQVSERLAENDSLVLLDVRTYEEYISEEGYINGAILIPVSELKSRTDELEKFRDKEIIVICSSGIRSSSATKFLRQKGFEAFNMQGGMQAWNKLTENVEIDSTLENYEKITE